MNRKADIFLQIRSFLCLADASRLRELSKGTRAVSKGAVLSDLPEHHFTCFLLPVFFRRQWMNLLHKSFFFVFVFFVVFFRGHPDARALFVSGCQQDMQSGETISYLGLVS